MCPTTPAVLLMQSEGHDIVNYKKIPQAMNKDIFTPLPKHTHSCKLLNCMMFPIDCMQSCATAVGAQEDIGAYADRRHVQHMLVNELPKRKGQLVHNLAAICLNPVP